MKRETKYIIKKWLDDAARYSKQAKAAVQYVDLASFQASLRGARNMLDSAEDYFKRGMDDPTA